ncbi:cyclic nucleotide-binding protein [Natrinema sp. CBA1119]|nr:cyclic nucleotide-binding protein [Natrinema sp. CBA1119]
MFSRVSVDDLELRSVDDLDQRGKAVGYDLQPEAMRPNSWVFEQGDTGNRHHHREQEELYLAFDGRFRLKIGDETIELEAKDVVVVSPEEWRQVTALEDGTLFVGAPNVADDGVCEDD